MCSSPHRSRIPSSVFLPVLPTLPTPTMLQASTLIIAAFHTGSQCHRNAERGWGGGQEQGRRNEERAKHGRRARSGLEKRM
eukprot:3021887-Rhodomonas_salina.1